MPLDDAYCNALLLVYWSVRQKLNRVGSVQLRRSVHAFSGRRTAPTEQRKIYTVDT